MDDDKKDKAQAGLNKPKKGKDGGEKGSSSGSSSGSSNSRLAQVKGIKSANPAERREATIAGETNTAILAGDVMFKNFPDRPLKL